MCLISSELGAMATVKDSDKCLCDRRFQYFAGLDDDPTCLGSLDELVFGCFGELAPTRPDTNKAGISFRIRQWDSETHETHKDCDNELLNDNTHPARPDLSLERRAFVHHRQSPSLTNLIKNFVDKGNSLQIN